MLENFGMILWMFLINKNEGRVRGGGGGGGGGGGVCLSYEKLKNKRLGRR